MRTNRPLAEPLDRRQLLAADVGVSFTLAPSYQPGDGIDGSLFQVTNWDSAITKGEFAYKVFLASDEAGTKDVAVVATGDVPALAAYDEAANVTATTTLDFHYVVPAALLDQSRFLIVALDGATPDEDPSDNRVSDKLRVGSPPDDPVPPPNYDLGVSFYPDDYYQAGTTIEGSTVSLTNYYDAIAKGQFTYRAILASDADGTKDVVEIAAGDVPALGSDETGALDFHYVVPKSMVGTSPYLIVTLDGDTPDQFPDDNRTVGQLRIVSDTLYDVGFDYVSYLEPYYRPGDVVDGNAFTVVSYQTSTTAGQFKYRAILASDEAGTKDVIEIASGNVPAVQTDTPGVPLDFRYVVPQSLEGEARHLIVTLTGDTEDFYPDDNVVSVNVRVASTLASATIVGTSGSDRFELVDGDDDGTFAVTRSSDVPEGDSGIVVGRYADFPTLTFDLGDGDDFLYASYAPASVPTHVIGGAGNDVLEGGNADDTIDGGDGYDHLFGHDGNDQIDGGADEDQIEGGAGNDRLAGNAGRDTIVGGDGDDRINGGANPDRLDGGAGNDTLLGQGGRDHLRGQAGNDLLIGGAGDDVIDGVDTDGVDTLSGGRGHDAGYVDASDLLASIELRLA